MKTRYIYGRWTDDLLLINNPILRLRTETGCLQLCVSLSLPPKRLISLLLLMLTCLWACRRSQLCGFPIRGFSSWSQGWGVGGSSWLIHPPPPEWNGHGTSTRWPISFLPPWFLFGPTFTSVTLVLFVADSGPSRRCFHTCVSGLLHLQDVASQLPLETTKHSLHPFLARS